jgi:hypothetical protein
VNPVGNRGPEGTGTTWARRELKIRSTRIRRSLAQAAVPDKEQADPQHEDREAEP